MPANDDRHGPRSRRTLTKAISIAAAAIGALALAACTSTTMTASVAVAPAAVTGTGAGSAGTLTGAGSTYVAPFLALALAKYHQQHPSVTVSYSAVGSSAGIAYHLDLPAGARLRLTGPVLAGIFLGQITRWNDPAITVLNPGINLPGAPITVVHRSDGSGTTYIFSNYLSSVSPAWAARVGTGKTLSWPAGEGAEGNGGVTSTVLVAPGNCRRRPCEVVPSARARPLPPDERPGAHERAGAYGGCVSLDQSPGRRPAAWETALRVTPGTVMAAACRLGPRSCPEVPFAGRPPRYAALR